LGTSFDLIPKALSGTMKLWSVLVLLCFLILACASQKAPKQARGNAVKMTAFDALIVPGIPYENNGWDSVMKARVLWSWILYKNGIVKNIIYSGGAVYSPYYEAYVMGLYAQKLGIPAEHIFYDTLAHHSTENVYYSYLLARKLKFKSLALGTDPFQSFMLRGFTRKRFGTPIYHIPFVTDSLKKYNHLEPQIDAHSARALHFVSIKERESFMKRIKGTVGRNIHWKQYQSRRVPPL
jgi:uncharacterized SAM-binding protein YcdF (DUF218 family)